MPGPLAAQLHEALGHRYALQRELGEGGMAVVYLARDLRHDRLVALKVLRPELSRLLGADRFLREIHIAAQLNHPHILPLHDSGDAGGLLYYVMPYVEGDAVRARLAREGALPVDEAVRIAAEVADGLHHAHAHGIVHRDIKPENILLEEAHATIADFGIAHAAAGADLTRTTGTRLGTPGYMSPEQSDPDAPLDQRADVYGLGCTLYEMLTGRPPFPGPSISAMVAQHARAPVPSVRRLRRDVGFALDAVVRRAMAKRPADRFPDAAAFREALLGCARGRRFRLLPVVRAIPWRRTAVVTALAGGAVLFARTIAGHGRRGAAGPAQTRVVVPYFQDRTGHSRARADALTEQIIGGLQDAPALAVPAGPMLAELRGAPLSAVQRRYPSDYIVVGRLDTSAAGAPRASLEVVRVAGGLGVGDTAVDAAPTADVAAAGEALTQFVSTTLARELDLADRRSRVRDDRTWEMIERANALADAAESALLLRYDREAYRTLDDAESLLVAAQRRDAGNAVVALDRARFAERRAFYAEYLAQVTGARPAAGHAPGDLRRRALRDLDAYIRDRPARADLFEMRGRIREGLYRELPDDALLEGAIADFEAARSHDPSRVTAWWRLGSAYLSAGRYALALHAAVQAGAKDVLRLHTRDLLRTRFDAAYGAERFDEADVACRAGLARWPDDMRFRDCLPQLWSRAPLAPGRVARAAALHDSLRATDAGPFFTDLRAAWLAALLARAGRPGDADRVAAGVTVPTAPAARAALLLELAWVRLARLDRDSARVLLDGALRADPATRTFARTSPWLRALRDATPAGVR